MAEHLKYKETLFAIQSTISNYDSKATSLLTAVGIVFGFSMFSVQEFSCIKGITRIFCLIIGLIYLIAFATSIILLVWIIFPRDRNKKEKQNAIDYALYYKDVFKHRDDSDFNTFLDEQRNEKALLEQIRICSRIAVTKERLLKTSVITIIFFTVSLVALVILLVI